MRLTRSTKTGRRGALMIQVRLTNRVCLKTRLYGRYTCTIQASAAFRRACFTAHTEACLWQTSARTVLQSVEMCVTMDIYATV